ncbi:MAG: lipopolysaccharide biosynthesis protein [Chromatiales bacterium]|nr:lipopolysaccharide biosynthesis protein [Chromatiales bacterium]
MSEKSLSAVAFSGLLWVTSSTALVTVGRLINLVVLARLLMPEDFGVLAVGVVIVSLTQFLVQMGLPAALVQKDAVSQRDLNTVLTLSVAAASAGVGVLCVAAPTLASLVGSPDVARVVPVLASTLVIQALFDPAEAMLRRELKFNALARVDVGSYVLGYFAPSIGLALAGFGVWSLVAAYVGEKACRCLQLLWIRGLVGRPGFSHLSVKQLLRFGLGFTMANFSNVAATRGDKAALGRGADAAIVGEYDRAYQIMVLPANVMDGIVARVLFPALARVKDNPDTLRTNYSRGLALTVAVMLPVATLCALLSAEVIRVLLGDRWTASVAMFQVLSGAMLFRCTYKLSDELSQACGAVYRRAWRQIIYAIAVIAGALVGSRWGGVGAATGVSLAIVFNFALMVDLTNRLTGLRWRDIAKAHWPGVQLAAIGALPATAIATVGRVEDWPDIGVLACSGSAAVLAIGVALLMRPTMLGPAGAWVMQLGRQAMQRSGGRVD